MPREVDPEALALFLAYGYVPSPRTLFKGIRKIRTRAGACAATRAVPRLERYWRSVPQIATASANPKPSTSTRALLRQAVERQMVSDVPVGCMLSGGVDSGLVVAIMSELSPTPGANLLRRLRGRGRLERAGRGRRHRAACSAPTIIRCASAPATTSTSSPNRSGTSKNRCCRRAPSPSTTCRSWRAST